MFLMKKLIAIIILFIFILGLSVGVLGPNFKCRFYFECNDMAEISTAIERYKTDRRKLPSSLKELTLKLPNKAAYLSKLPQDPWGHDYFYFYNENGSYVLGTYGEDGVWGGEDFAKDIFFHSEPCMIKFPR